MRIRPGAHAGKNVLLKKNSQPYNFLRCYREERTGQILLSPKKEEDVIRGQLYTYRIMKVAYIQDQPDTMVVDCGLEIRILPPSSAKRFLENELKGCPFIVAKTYKSDKYDRYLVDVFYSPGKYKTLLTAKKLLPGQQRRYDDRREEFFCKKDAKDGQEVADAGNQPRGLGRLLNSILN